MNLKKLGTILLLAGLIAGSVLFYQKRQAEQRLNTVGGALRNLGDRMFDNAEDTRMRTIKETLMYVSFAVALGGVVLIIIAPKRKRRKR